ncbi:cobalamin-binding protein [Allomuricauda sp. SCSIO 65647]|uniref:cobalamin-binding protein n=1 Tax=Allomuricauda sp. SCSIO 65647 TaxID=2908843 RepID=UPI001F36F856|nr:cobalamin-binding protein [Muricauda sp. SCSIO 65647]UJH67672.1 cobalamin-binding protein [Muricauda sp. SCSIO 65647]
MKSTTNQRPDTDYGPKRIVCLTEETTETLYLLGEESRIVGVSGFTVRPKRARKEKPKVSTFVDANIDEILALRPDLVIGFSDIQATIAKELIKRGVTVWINNHRSVQGILEMMVQLGALVDKREQAMHLVQKIETNIRQIGQSTSDWNKKPKVYFEEWYDPLITGIQWVSELIELAGGNDVFPENRRASLAKDRIIEDKNELVRRNPDIILASWCGKMFKKQKMLQRPNWQNITAVRRDDVFEIKSEIILQPGPAALMEGLPLLHQLFSKWIAKYG